MAGIIERNSPNLHDQDTGVLVGYVNPLTGKQEAMPGGGEGGVSTDAGNALETGTDGKPFLDEALVTGAGISAPSTLDGSSASVNSLPLLLAAGGTLTVAAGARAVLPAGVSIRVGRTGTATLAFSGGATKENASGTSATSVTLVASGVYALLPGDSTDTWRLVGGASA